MTRSLALILLSLLVFSPAAGAGQDMLTAADQWRLPFEEGRLTVTLTSDGDSSRYAVLIRADGTSRAEMLDPRQRGQKVLLAEDGLWLSMPRSHRIIRLTPLQRLMGQASYGDLARLRWARDYRVDAAVQEEEDGAWRLSLIATAATAPYGSLTLWLDAATFRPLRATFFLPSGRALKTAVFGPPVTVLGREIIDTITFADIDTPESQTTMQISAFVAESLPAALFTVEGLRQ